MMKDAPDHLDADLILKLYDLRREESLRAAREKLTSEFWPKNAKEAVAVVALDHPLDNCEAHAGPFEFVGAVEALEDTEELVGEGHVEPGTVVAHEVGDLLASGVGAAYFDHRFLLVTGELEGIREEIKPNLAQEGRVPVAGVEAFDLEFDFAPLALGRKRVDHLADYRVHVDHLEV